MALSESHSSTGTQKTSQSPTTHTQWSGHRGLRTYLSLGFGGRGRPQKALAQNSAHSSSIGVVPKHRAELQSHVHLQLTGKH